MSISKLKFLARVNREVTPRPCCVRRDALRSGNGRGIVGGVQQYHIYVVGGGTVAEFNGVAGTFERRNAWSGLARSVEMALLKRPYMAPIRNLPGFNSTPPPKKV
jgi:hypothetical protein